MKIKEVLRVTSRKALEDTLSREEKENLCEEIGLSKGEIEEVGKHTTSFIEVWSRRADLRPDIGTLFDLLKNAGHDQLIHDIKPRIGK